MQGKINIIIAPVNPPVKEIIFTISFLRSAHISPTGIITKAKKKTFAFVISPGGFKFLVKKKDKNSLLLKIVIRNI